MFIGDLKPKQNISLLVQANGNSLTFESKIQESYPEKNMIITDPVISNGRPVSFRGEKVIVNILVFPTGEKPVLFKNVASKLFKKKNGEFCYCFATLSEGVFYNRRENFRCYVGVGSSMQCRLNSIAQPVLIRDISSTGFALICDSDIKLEQGQLVHTVLNDQPKTNGSRYSFHLYGFVARVQELENGKLLYGCRLNNSVPGLDKYIMEKERIHLRNGGHI